MAGSAKTLHEVAARPSTGPMPPIQRRGSRACGAAARSVPAIHRCHSGDDMATRPGSAPGVLEETEPRPLTPLSQLQLKEASRPGSIRALAKMSNAELLMHIGRMRHAEVPDIVQHVSDRMQGNSSAATLGHSVVRRVGELISITPLHALSQAGDLVVLLQERAHGSCQALAGDGQLRKLLEARLSHFLYQPSAEDAFDSLARCHEQAAQLALRGIVAARHREVAAAHLVRWAELAPFAKLGRQAHALRALAEAVPSLATTLHRRLRDAPLRSLAPEPFQAYVTALFALRDCGLAPSDALLDDFLEVELPVPIAKAWSAERLALELRAADAGLRRLCKDFNRTALAVNSVLSARIARALVEMAGSFRENDQLLLLQEGVDRWRRIALKASEAGLASFGSGARRATLDAFSACYARCCERPELADSAEAVAELEWGLICLFGGQGPAPARAPASKDRRSPAPAARFSAPGRFGGLAATAPSLLALPHLPQIAAVSCR